VAELVTEWTEKNGFNIPPEIIDSFPKNLFECGSITDDSILQISSNDLVKQFSTFEPSKGGIKVACKEPNNGAMP
jgi:hypothetical protein